MPFLFLLLISLFIPIHAFAGGHWTQYTDYSGITSMVDDGKNLWMGTRGGLVRLDKASGKKTIFNRLNSGLTDIHILSLALDGSGKLWIGTESGGLLAFDGSSWTQYHSGNSPLRKQAIALLPGDSTNGLWILARNDHWSDTVPQILHKQGDLWEEYVLPEIPGEFSRSTRWVDMKVDTLGRIWITSIWGYYGIQDRALFRIDRKGSIAVIPSPDLDYPSHAMVTETGDILWFNGEQIIRQKGNTRISESIPHSLAYFWFGENLQARFSFSGRVQLCILHSNRLPNRFQ